MLLSLTYLVVRIVLRLLAPDGQDKAAKDLEIIVLRHEFFAVSLLLLIAGG